MFESRGNEDEGEDVGVAKASMEKSVRFEDNESEDDEEAIDQDKNGEVDGGENTLTNGQMTHNLQPDREVTGKWRNVTKQIRNAVAVKNAVKPSRTRRRSTWKSPVTVDPFLQKFSTRDNRKLTPPNRKRSKPASKTSSTDNVLSNHGTLSPPSFEIERELDSELTSGSVYDYDQNVRWRDKKLVFDPDGRFICVWFYFLVFAIRYNLWALIARIAFPEAQSGLLKVAWFVFDYLCDAIYVVDIVITARTGFLEEGILVTDTKRVSMRYIRSVEFVADILSLVPTDFLYAVFGPLPLIRINRVIKSYKSFTIKAVMESQANYPTFLRVFFLMHLMFLLIHWNAGFYIMISRAEGFGTNEWVYQGNGSLYQQYLQSFYWSTLTLTAIGDLPQPTTNIEYVYTITCYLTGVFMFASIVGNAGSIIVNRNAVRMDFEKQRENTKQYMKKHNVPRNLQRRVVMWYDYSYARGRMSTGGGDLNSLTLLPNKLKTEIALHVNLETLRKVTFLQKCQPEFLHDLVLKMKLRIFTPGDLVCRKSEVAREMYVIINGRIEVIGDQGQVLKTLSGGDFFGEIGILSLSEGQNRRTADVRTVGYVECFVLSKEDVLSAIRDYPEAQAVLADYGKKRLERQNSSQDPRFVDMEDINGVKQLGNIVNNKDYSDESLSQKIEHLQRITRGNENTSDTPVNSSSTNSCSTVQRTHALYSLRIPQPSIRAVLDPISPSPRLGRNRLLSCDAVLQSPLQAADSKSSTEPPVSCDPRTADTSNDDLMANMFSTSCMEAFNVLQKTFKEKLTKEVANVSNTLKEIQETTKQKDDKIKFLKGHLTAQEQEMETIKLRVKELESENYIKEQIIRQMKEQEEFGSKKSSRSRTMSSTVSSASLLEGEKDTHC